MNHHLMQQRPSFLKKMNRDRWIAGFGKALPVIYFFFVLFLYYSLLGEPFFADEQESYVGAYSVLKGKDLYSAYHCQHMPFSYYYAVPLALLGARTVFQFRLGTYLLLAVLWELLYLRHRRSFHTAVFFAMPLLYLTALKPIHLGTGMLADHWQGLGLVFILLEVVRYADTKELSKSCAFLTSLGVALSLGFSFASAYSLCCFFLAASAIQISALRKGRPEGHGSSASAKIRVRQILRVDLYIVLLALLPFVLLLGCYALTGNLRPFYVSCFENVTKNYSKYIDDLGSDPLRVVWTTPRDFCLYLAGLVRDFSGYPWSTLLYAACAVSVFALGWRLARKNPAAGVLTLLAIIYGGIRGFQEFHSMAFQAMSTASLALCLGWLLQRKWRRTGIRWALRGGALAAGAVLLADFAVWGGYNLLYPQILQDRTLRSEEQILDLLTETDEEVFICNLPVNSLDVMDLELVPKENCLAILYPFYYEPWRDQLMASIQDQPHVVLYDPETRNAGPAYREYASDFDAYVKAHYTRLPQAETIWVSNPFLPEAQRRLEEAGYGSLLVSDSWNIGGYHAVELLPGMSVTAAFEAKEKNLTAVRFCASCFHRRSDPSLAVRLRDHETGELLAENLFTGQDIADNLFSRCPLPAELIPGHPYDLEFLAVQIRGKGDMEIYLTPEDQPVLAEEYRLEGASAP